MKTSREQFEEWFLEALGTDANHGIAKPISDKYWKVWQASREAIEVELPEWFVDKVCHVYDADEVKQVIESAGIKIKGA